ncbi:MAG: SRPBCC family protein [Acidimicrobiia bacterium]
MAAHSRGSVSVERLIAAPAARIFDVLADPTQHPVIDGSGMVREARAERPSRLSPGATFGMSMRMGVAYAMTNEVVQFDENRRIAWRPRLARPAALARFTGGHVWRYELEPAAAGTRVRESYDWSKADAFTRAYIVGSGWPRRAERAMVKTLERLDAHVTPGS